MFDIENTKSFMDSVHGYINIPTCFVDNLIDNTYFQRLRNISQTGMRVLYPDGKHDRFCHSLGVYYIGNKAVDCLLNNFHKDVFWNVYSNHSNVIFWAKNKILFLIACLLHDIGHAPFSHSVENIVVTNSSGFNSFRNTVADLINAGEKNAPESENYIKPSDVSCSAHEMVSARLVIEKFYDNISKVFDELIADEYPKTEANDILFAEYYEYNPIIDKNDISSDICFIARMITGLKYKSHIPEYQIKNCFIELLNGNDFDVDKLDYIIRDTMMSGISNVSIDVERLLNSLSIVTSTVYCRKIFQKNEVLSDSTVHALSNNTPNQSFHIKGNIKGKFVFETDCDVDIKESSTFLSFRGGHENSKICYIGENARFKAKTTLYKNGTNIKTDGRDNSVHLPEENGNAEFECYIKETTIVSKDGFHFLVKRYSYELDVNGFCELIIKGNFKIVGSLTCFNDVIFNGFIDKFIVLKNLLTASIPTLEAYNAFHIGFKKQAMNIVANVLEARDYLYLWSYAHHKVVYYSNFLIPAILSAQYFSEKKPNYLLWGINYDSLQYIDDDYFWTGIKYLLCDETIKDNELTILCNEIITRKYKNSLYKSLSEYDLFFEGFSDSNKLTLRNYLSHNIDKTKPFVESNGNTTAGIIKKDVLDCIINSDDSELKKVEELVFVDASYSLKNLNAHNTFLIINNQIVPVEKVDLLSGKSLASLSKTEHYFYLYYSFPSKDKEEVSRFNDLLKKALKTYFFSNITSIEKGLID